jgi:malate dehydrogenase
MVRAILQDSGEVLPSCVYLNGQYGIEDVYMTVPATLGAAGVVAVDEIALTADELAALQASAATVSAAVDALGLRE